MGFIQNIINQYRQKREARNAACNQYIDQMDRAMQEIYGLFADPRSVITPEKEAQWYAHNSHLLTSPDVQKTRGAVRFGELSDKQAKLREATGRLKQQIVCHNERVLQMKIQDAYALIGKVEGRDLDKQQMACIVMEAHNHLVLAGAGTGKTTTIVGKIKYLIKSGQCRPEDILVLSFTNASAAEMSHRIVQETGCHIDAFTFHKLGMNIITQVEGIVPKIFPQNMHKFITEQLRLQMQSERYLMLLSSYLLNHRILVRSEFDFQNMEEYHEYLQLNPPTTLGNEMVKSYGEMEIANFLAQNNVSYIYEHPYKIGTRTAEYGQYMPDFYLPDYDIYIEYFGINQSGEVPSYFRGSHGMTASQAYQASMNWKRRTHRENGTIMVECFAYERMEGTLLNNLKQKLADHGVTLSPKNAQELWEQASSSGDAVLDGVATLLEAVINLIKSNGYTIPMVRQMNCGIHALSNALILSLVEPIFEVYNSFLKERGEIDFNDMIHLATEYVEEGKYVNPYKYVIVDEYQDISRARYILLDRMRKCADYALFCVGDDWQSIYRFAGSDIGFILDFQRYWGVAETSRIETTYRFTQKLAEISGSFIMRNSAQMRKSIKGKQDIAGFPMGEISAYTDKYAVQFMLEKLDDLPQKSSIFFIGRYTFDADLLKGNDLLACRYDNARGQVEVKYRNRSDLQMYFVTAHKSKGLQADYIFIINNRNARMGFPSKIQDAPILQLLLEKCDQYPDAEERRLFYVALTRARKKVFLLTVDNQESAFVKEIRSQYGEALRQERFTCPVCGARLKKKSGPYGDFLGCSNYKITGCKYTRNLKRKAD